MMFIGMYDVYMDVWCL